MTQVRPQDGRDYQEVRLADEIIPFLTENSEKELFRILRDPNVAAPQALEFDVLRFAELHPEAVDQLFRAPDAALAALNEALVAAQQHLLQQDPDNAELTVKDTVDGRLTGIPCSLHSGSGPSIGQLRAADVGRLIVVTGTVLRTGSVQVLEAIACYECLKCGHQFDIAVDMEAGATVDLPRTCPSGKAKPCKGSSFRRLTDQPRHCDFQEMRVQEKAPESTTAGVPAAVTVLLRNTLVDTCQPGDDVVITAVVSQRWPQCFKGARCSTELMLTANNLVVTSARKCSGGVTPEAEARFAAFWKAHGADRLAGRDKLAALMCRKVRGLGLAKLAALLALIGGLPRTGPDGSRVRGEIHMLMVGDPGTGKSQLMKYVAKVAARSVVTSGRGSSAAGLTATAVKDGQGWALEAGAMVLADGGVCCIDEFDGMGGATRAAMHEAMEQQTVSVAKAGLLTTLNARTSVFGACNPRGCKFEARESLTANTSLSGPLLSRFDVVLLLRDVRQRDVDAAIADHVLGGCMDDGRPCALDWDTDLLQQYVRWAKGFKPTMTRGAEALLLQYYQMQRQRGTADASRTTVRMLESLVRMSQAHARLVARAEVTQQDAVVAIMLVDASMGEAAVLHVNPMLPLSSSGAEGELASVERRLLEIFSQRSCFPY